MIPIRVVIADDNQMIRQGIRSFLAKEPDIQLVAEAVNGVDALTLIDRLEPDVLLLDIQMPEMDGFQVARDLQKAKTLVKILAVSAYDDPYLVEGMLGAGVHGYLLKDDLPYLLPTFIRSIVDADQVCLSPRIAA